MTTSQRTINYDSFFSTVTKFKIVTIISAVAEITTACDT